MTPIIAAFPKMLVPIIVVIPGLVALLVLPEFSQSALPSAEYNSALILLMKHYLPNGLLGLAITALLASFMSGMAGNVTAFNTIWTYDITAPTSEGQPTPYVKVGAGYGHRDPLRSVRPTALGLRTSWTTCSSLVLQRPALRHVPAGMFEGATG
jgi:uncharacterized sodium:solute symporter family permease YidK